MQLSASASTTRFVLELSSADTTETVPEVTRIPGPTSVALRFSARRTTRSAARVEKVPSGSAGNATTGISSMRDCTMGAMVSGTASVT